MALVHRGKVTRAGHPNRAAYQVRQFGGVDKHGTCSRAPNRSSDCASRATSHPSTARSHSAGGLRDPTWTGLGCDHPAQPQCDPRRHTVALPATFTLATSLGASVLGKLGVVPIRLSVVDEPASVGVLSVDKTGTPTQLSRDECERSTTGGPRAHVRAGYLRGLCLRLRLRAQR